MTSTPLNPTPGHRGFPILCAVLFLVFGLSVPLGAQSATELDSPLYSQLEIWQARGILNHVPMLRPYTIQVLTELLRTVEDSPKSNETDKLMASDFLHSFGDGLHLTAQTEGRLRSSSGTEDGSAVSPDTAGYFHASPGFWANAMVTDWLSASVEYHLWAVDFPDGQLEPQGTRAPEDFVKDDTNLAVGSTELQVRQMAHSYVGLGSVDGVLTAQLGISRNSAGPFWDDGIILGPQAPVAGNLSLLFRLPGVEATIGLFPISASQDNGSGMESGKLIYYHDLTVRASPNLDLSVFETIVSGRIDPLYFVPLSAFFYSQGLTGFSDNSLLGFTARGRLMDGLDLKGVLYLDDIGFNELVRFDFNTKYKLAFQAGAAWSPSSTVGAPSWFPLVSLDYTAVMPYMYTHKNDSGPGFNFENYTNWGVNLGPDLDPNSDRIKLRAVFQPLYKAGVGSLSVVFNSAFIRHGNASAGITNGDGSILDPGYAGGTPTFQPPFHDPTGQPYTRFLTQSVIQRTLQFGLGLEYQLGYGIAGLHTRGAGRLSVDAGYTFEHVWNANLNLGSETNAHYFQLALSYQY